MKTSLPVKELKAIVGAGNVLTATEELLCYSYDASPTSPSPPQAVVLPASTEEVCRVVALVTRSGLPIIPRGAGTGLSGAAIPVSGGIVLSLTRMNRILEIDRENLTVTVEPGVVTGLLHSAVEQEGLFYPPDPASAIACTLGGNAATGAGGLRALKYGVTRHYVLGLEVVLPNGEVMTTGARTVKNSTGYDLTRLMVGSEGTLGIFTRLHLRLLPMPAAKKTLLASFPSASAAAATVSAIIAQGLLPATLEFMDRVTIQCVEAHIKAGLPGEAEALLLIESDGARQTVEEEAERLAALCREHQTIEVKVARDAKEAEALTLARRSVIPALSRARPTLFLEDATVPPSHLVEMVAAVGRIAAKYQLLAGTMGHAGDGNLHPFFLGDSRHPEELHRMEAAVRETVEAALALGGTVSGEHGLGVRKAPFLPLKVSPAELKVMQTIKQAFDPDNLFNPGKLFPPPEATPDAG